MSIRYCVYSALLMLGTCGIVFAESLSWDEFKDRYALLLVAVDSSQEDERNYVAYISLADVKESPGFIIRCSRELFEQDDMATEEIKLMKLVTNNLGLKTAISEAQIKRSGQDGIELSVENYDCEITIQIDDSLRCTNIYWLDQGVLKTLERAFMVTDEHDAEYVTRSVQEELGLEDEDILKTIDELDKEFLNHSDDDEYLKNDDLLEEEDNESFQAGYGHMPSEEDDELEAPQVKPLSKAQEFFVKMGANAFLAVLKFKAYLSSLWSR